MALIDPKKLKDLSEKLEFIAKLDQARRSLQPGESYSICQNTRTSSYGNITILTLTDGEIYEIRAALLRRIDRLKSELRMEGVDI